jgi:hypothetical protein
MIYWIYSTRRPICHYFLYKKKFFVYCNITLLYYANGSKPANSRRFDDLVNHWVKQPSSPRSLSYPDMCLYVRIQFSRILTWIYCHRHGWNFEQCLRPIRVSLPTSLSTWRRCRFLSPKRWNTSKISAIPVCKNFKLWDLKSSILTL